ncbi:hypothetical protein WD019_04585 [Fictibacillus sp. Mic-4]|uniref:hypothetical protein n=1 Tax=Fictibacillus sp. Mic-4 TaxID=3132826 RepID=UPI003CFA5CD7
MTNTLKDAQNKIHFAQTLRGEYTKFFREVLDEYRSKKGLISSNRELSDEGKRKQIEKLNAVYERKFLELSRDLQREAKKAAKEAKQTAEVLLVSELPKVDAHKRSLFDRKVEEIEAKVKFALTPARAKEALSELLALADEPALAHEIKGKILALSEHVISLAPPADQLNLRKEIGDLYDTAARNALPDGAEDAKKVIETADGILNTSGISSAVEIALREVSVWTSTYIHNPDEYLNQVAGSTSNEQQTQEADERLRQLAEKARTTGSMDDKLAYISAKRAIQGGAK